MGLGRSSGIVGEMTLVAGLAADGSLIAPDGRVVLFSKERFERDVCLGDCCFVCGAAPDSKPFNDEHILPRWLLRRHNLFEREITLPNGNSYRYGRYKIPCCEECNTFMGRNVEEPVRTLLASGHQAVGEHLRTHGPDLLYRWLSLIYVKTHLRDATIPWNRDRRNDVGPIGDLYEWSAFHHIHAVARSIREGIQLGHRVVGSFVALPALDLEGEDDFDFGDTYRPRAILIRTGKTALVAVLNDAGAAQFVYSPKLKKVSSPLSSPQLREILAHFAYINEHLSTRPKFSTVDVGNRFEIRAVLRDLNFDWSIPPTLGTFMSHVCGPLLEGMPRGQRAVIEKGLADGAWSWMFDAEGRFIGNGDHEK